MTATLQAAATGSTSPQLPQVSRTAPIVRWAAVGGVLLVVELFFLAKWVTGPRFTPTVSGPDSPPQWMEWCFAIGQVAFPLMALVALYWFIVRPWRREQRVTTDGLICIAALLAAPWDSLSTYGNYWFTYNSALVDFGSPVGELPGVVTPRLPGVSEAYPILMTPAFYVFAFIGIAMLGCALMRVATRRWPRIGSGRLVLVAFAGMMVFVVVVEGVLFVPLGLYQYNGGHWLINSGHYYAFPLIEAPLAGAVFTGLTCLRYFTDDRGETLVERGVSRLRVSKARGAGLRLLAVVAALHLMLFVGYQLPTMVVHLSSQEWSEDVENRSYFTNGICGPEVDRACPGPATPGPRPDAPRLRFDGRNLAAPDGG